MKIANVEVFELEIPFDRGTKVESPKSFLKASGLDFCLIKLESDSGLIGWGEAFAYHCRPAVAAAIEHMVKPLLIGKDVRDVLGINADLQKMLHMYGRYGITMFAISGVDIALWDLLGKRLNQPIFEIFGSSGNSRVPAYASLWRYEDPELVADRVKAARSLGYGMIKLHEVGLAEVHSARDVVGPEIPLMLDTNCPWTLLEAREMVLALREYNLYWLEEPLSPPEDFSGLSYLKNETGVRIASGEHACTAFQFRDMLQKGAIDFAQPSVTKVGGITEFRKVINLCESCGVQVMPHSPYFGPGFLATLHLSQVSNTPGFVERFFVKPEANLYPEEILNPMEGNFSVPKGPGLGFDPDMDVVKTYLTN